MATLLAAAIALAVGWSFAGAVSHAEDHGGGSDDGGTFAITSITANCNGSGTVSFTGDIPAGGFTLTLMTKASDNSGAFFPAPGVPVLTFTSGTSSISYQFDLTAFVGGHLRVDSNFQAKSDSLFCGGGETSTATSVPATNTPTSVATATRTPTGTVGAATTTPHATRTVGTQTPRHGDGGWRDAYTARDGDRRGGDKYPRYGDPHGGANVYAYADGHGIREQDSRRGV